MATVTINVGGMSCKNCVKSISDGLTALGGVQNVDASIEGKKVDVNYDESKVGVDAMKKAIYDLGFDVG
ncbi:MAG: copper ion binding protein [Deferribacteraceae bacterium]|jgi:copper chaperone|nr:copper ion binding protein [Deferribacteraceae bacterium]